MLDPRVRNLTYGYAYPDWYPGVVDSPAKIAQQLAKYGSKRLQRLQELNRTVPLTFGSLITQPMNKFTMLEEPRFVGFGTVDVLNNKEARLSCSFNEAIDQANVSC